MRFNKYLLLFMLVLAHTAFGRAPMEFIELSGSSDELIGSDSFLSTLVESTNSTTNSSMDPQIVSIPDANFKTYLIANFDTDNDGEISYAEAAAVTGQINVSNKNISDLSGIEAFVNITDLWCFQNQLTSLDLSQNTQLWRINARNNQLTAVDFSANIALTQLSIESNNLSSLNVQNGNNSNLTYFFAHNNPNLTCIQVDNPTYSTSNWTGSNFNFGSGIVFSNDCNTTYTIQTQSNPSAGGNTTGSGTYQSGQNVLVHATPNPYYTFARWTENGAQVSSTAAYSFQADSDRTLVAEFTAMEHTVTVTANQSAWGNVSGGGSYPHGSTITISATPNFGYQFVRWTSNGNTVSTNPDYTITVNYDRAFVAEFAVATHTVTWESDPTGFNFNLNGNPNYNNSATVTHGSSLSLQAYTYNSGYQFARWSEDGVELTTNSTYTFTVESARNLLAEFEPKLFLVSTSVSPAQAGTVTGGGYIPYSAPFTLEAFPNTGYQFKRWVINNNPGAGITANPYYAQGPNHSWSVVAEFELVPLTVTATANPSNGGTVSGAGTFNYGTTVNLTATPNTIMEFVRWTENGVEVSTANPYSFTLEENRNLVAEFQNNELYVYIPDPAFKNYLLGQPSINTVNDGEISFAEAAAFTGAINCSAYNISDLTGIEAFVNLTSLTCVVNQISQVDLSANTELTFLNIRDNQLTALDLSNNTKITQLVAYNNQIASIDLGNSPQVQWIEIQNNQLTSIDISSASELISLEISNNQISSIDFSNNPELTQAICNNNQIASFDMSHNPKLTNLRFEHNQATELNLKNGTNTTKLAYIKAGYNNLSCVQVDNATYSTANWTGTPAGAYNIEFDPGVSFNEFCEDDCIINHVRDAGHSGAGNLQVRNIAADFVVTDNILKVDEVEFHLTQSLTGNATVAFFTDNNGQPGTLIHGPFQVSPSSQLSDPVPSSSWKVNFDFSSENIILSGNGTKYWVSISTPTQTNQWRGSKVIHHGTFIHISTDNYQTWSSFANFDTAFNIIGDCNAVLPSYEISASANPSAAGSITGAGNYNHGANVTLNATANAGYQFVRWTENGNQVSTSATYSFTANANRTLVAEFELIPVTQYTINASANPSVGGSVSGAGTYNQGETVTMTATANAGYQFVRWTENGNQVSTSATYSFTATANRTLVAEFELIPVTQYTITASANPSVGGSVSGAGTYNQGETVTLTATANNGYQFVRWTENGNQVSTSATYSFTATANRTLVAEFELIPVTQYTINASANPSVGGSVSGAGTYNQGETVTLTATANNGYQFVRWTENGNQVSTSATYSFTANANRTLVAEFELIPVTQYTITASANPSVGGSVSGAGTYNQGETVTLTATANAGYQFVRWTENGDQVSTSATYSFTANANRTLVAEFEQQMGVSDVNSLSLEVYPNPVLTILNIHTSSKTTAEIINLLGVRIETHQLEKGNNILDLRHLEKGVYFLRTAGKTIKLIKK